MIWHIFKKDWKLLRWMVMGVALINAMQRLLLSGTSPFGNARWTVLAHMFSGVAFLAAGALIVMVVQQDAIPGLRQDWLVRPIRPRDLLLSKILFVALLVQGPILIAEVGQGIAAGFPLSQSMVAPLFHSLWLLLAMDLPLLAFATLTRNLTEAVGAGVMVALGAAFFMTSTLTSYPGTGIEWVNNSMQLVWGMAAVAVLLAVQYCRRKTNAARWTFGFVTVVWLFAQLLPWQSAFAIQERLSAHPATGNPVQISFEPSVGPFHRPPGWFEPRHVVNSQIVSDVVVYVPVRASGVSGGGILIADQVTARLTGPSGKSIDLGRAGQIDRGVHWASHQLVWISPEVYNRIKDEPVRLELDYALTLLQPNVAHAMAALDGNQRTPDTGWCATRTNAVGTQIDFRCLIPGTAPCVVWSLEYAHPARRGSENSACQPDYSPYPGRLDPGDSMSRFGSFQSPAREAEWKDARVVFRVYRPEAHFTRHVVIPDIRLSDWRAQ